MSDRIQIKPSRPGLIVRDPRSKVPLPEQGARKPATTFWLRRLRSGDVVRVDENPKTAPVRPAQKSED